jgi:branched-chain amino acid aminotransferase
MNKALLNNTLTSLKELPEIDKSFTNIYEVVRLQNRVVLFAELHYQRFSNSLRLGGFSGTITFDEWLNAISIVATQNQISEGNIRYDIFQKPDNDPLTIVKIIPHHYPSNDEREQGIVTLLQFEERNTPNAKILNHALRENANDLIVKQNVYETLLVNRNNCITEGSRSNFLGVIGNQLVTAPDEIVLPGIMRNLVIEAARSLSIPIVFTCISVDKLHELEAAFITGTSPRVLPIRAIGDIELNVIHPVIQILSNAIEEKINHYIRQKSVK